MNNIKNYIIGGLVILAVVLFFSSSKPSFQGVTQSNVYTTSAGFAAKSTLINTTSTQVFASVNQLDYIVNNSAIKVTCSLDARNTTAASSSVAAGVGIQLVNTSTNPALPSSASFGACIPGIANCYPHTGAVNCLAAATTTVTTLVQ